MSQTLHIGIDLGTSGCRALAIDIQGDIQAQANTPMPAPLRNGSGIEQDPELWWQALKQTLHALMPQIKSDTVKSLAVDGTSGTLLLSDQRGQPLCPALMYNDARSHAEAARIAVIAPQESAAHGSTSALAKLLHLKSHHAQHALHQADWIVGKLTEHWGISDANNCLKLGYDAINHCWPAWLEQLDINTSMLPEVHQPGTPVATISAQIAAELGFPADTLVIAGTTDSTAAFIATGANQTGEAVTSLGSTLVLKVISDTPVFSPEHGVYSQPLGEKWLVGGGSNTGGAVLLHYFNRQQLDAMTPQLRPHQPTGLNYYPLIQAGERFPVADSRKQPCLTPRPNDDLVFFQAMLEGMARIEQQGYELLATLGAPYPISIRSAGGGSHNAAWTDIRKTLLGVPFINALQQEAAYGSALLARQGYLSQEIDT